MPGRHLRRAPAWWLRRALLLVLVAAIGAALGAGGWLLAEGDGDDEVVAGEGTAALSPEPGPVTLVVAGELHPGAALAARAGGPEVAGGFGDVFATADLAVVGLTGAVVEVPPADPVDAAWAPATVLDALQDVGVDVVSLASDRALDLGPDGLQQTLGAGDGRRVDLVGVGADEDAAYAPSVRDVGGVRIAVIGATQELAPERIASDTAGPGTPGVASAKRLDRLVAEVEAATQDADVVVVHVHWGEPGEACPTTSQQELAAALVDAGADVVAGSGTGTVQGAGLLGEAVVAYGLGGLVADGASEAGALEVEVDADGVAAWRWIPGGVVDGVAEPASDAPADDLAARQACAALTP